MIDANENHEAAIRAFRALSGRPLTVLIDGSMSRGRTTLRRDSNVFGEVRGAELDALDSAAQRVHDLSDHRCHELAVSEPVQRQEQEPCAGEHQGENRGQSTRPAEEADRQDGHDDCGTTNLKEDVP